jgi:tetraacyldisaccharide 4'-kinase
MVRILRCEGGNPTVRFVIDKVLHFYSGKEFVKKNAKANIVCGLGNPERFCSDLQDFGIEIGHKFFFKDHSKAFAAQFEKIIQNRPQETFVISEKDAARLPAGFIQKNVKSQIYIAYQATLVSPDVVQNLP